MLKRLHLQNFTVFADADFEFSPGLNVLVGTNGTGKSHVLKLGYAILHTATGRLKNSGPRRVEELGLPSLYNGTSLAWGKHNWSMELGEKLKAVFRPEPYELLELVRHDSKQIRANVTAVFGGEEAMESRFSISQVKSTELELTVEYLPDTNNPNGIAAPVFLPPKEVLTMAWVLAAYDLRQLPLDETYPDLLRQLNQLPLRETKVENELELIEQVLGGKVEEKRGRFYLKPAKGRMLEMNLVAEGIRKFAIIDKLLRNGSLTPQSTLFWDEPEANLNPALLRKLAAILAELARQGFQIILATHSTDLLKEFHILSRQKDAKPLPIKYFGLNAEPGEATRIISTDNFEFLPDVVALSEELKQADELEEIFIREDQEYHANNRGEE